MILVSIIGNTAQAATIYSASPRVNYKKSQLEIDFKSSSRFRLELHQHKQSIFIQFPHSQFQGDMLSLLSLQERQISFLPEIKNITVSQTLPTGKRGLYIGLHFKGQIHASLRRHSSLQQQVVLTAGSRWTGKKYRPVPQAIPTYKPQSTPVTPQAIPTYMPQPTPYMEPPITLNLPGPIRPQLKPPELKVIWKIAELNSIQTPIGRYRSPESGEVLTKMHWKQAFNLSKHKWHFMNKHQKITNHKYIQLGPGETLKLTNSNLTVNLRDTASLDLNNSVIDLHQGWMIVSGKLPVQNAYQFKVHPEFTPLTITGNGEFSFMASPGHIIVLKGYIDVNDTHHLHDQNSLKLEAGSHLDLTSHKVNQLTGHQLNQILIKSSMQGFIKAN